MLLSGKTVSNAVVAFSYQEVTIVMREVCGEAQRGDEYASYNPRPKTRMLRHTVWKV